ncbi:hypothetical protein HF908_19435 (plasmid) [Ralstonia pseudosolanacearum]|uniref:Uncharacterized protein n=2 Tax=Ralstonia solanacearum species complex TaxID=3116862 RepID=A0AA92Q8C9_RALSL|nr:hypothetical protein [Ralstonia pseudosolanacearum]QOK93688.1 hypothetical protein HF908_19435 [Ralstonia pseudosolanacearum]QOK98558.1 hypothetical protein HF909_19005 [Ralstonia pseudosolanacearum]
MAQIGSCSHQLGRVSSGIPPCRIAIAKQKPTAHMRDDQDIGRPIHSTLIFKHDFLVISILLKIKSPSPHAANIQSTDATQRNTYSNNLIFLISEIRAEIPDPIICLRNPIELADTRKNGSPPAFRATRRVTLRVGTLRYIGTPTPSRSLSKNDGTHVFRNESGYAAGMYCRNSYKSG